MYGLVLICMCNVLVIHKMFIVFNTFLRFGALLNHLEMLKDYAGIHYLKLQFFLYFFSQPTMLQWIELLTKQFNNSQAACEVSDLGTQQSTNQLSIYCLTFLEVRIPGIFWTMNYCVWYICALWDEIHPLITADPGEWLNFCLWKPILRPQAKIILSLE